MSMRVYVGHQVDDPEAVFFVFAETKQEALEFLSNEEIEAHEASLTVVHDPGAVLFRPRRGRLPGEIEDLRFGGELPSWEDGADQADEPEMRA